MTLIGVMLPKRRQHMEMLLRNDDAQTCAKEFNATDMHDWVLTNVVDAMNRLPKVLNYWITEHKKNGGFINVLYRHAAMHLESLSDEDKITLLKGHSYVPAHTNLYNFLNTFVVHWHQCSPAWVGTPGSPLRLAAMALGWEPVRLSGMVVATMENVNADTWSHLVPYKYSLHALEWLAQARVINRMLSGGLGSNAGAASSPSQAVCVSANANPMDIALAKHLLTKSAVPPRHHYEYPEHFEVVSVEEDLQLKTLVDTYWSLGMEPEFKRALIDGVLPGWALERPTILELPLLDGGL